MKVSVGQIYVQAGVNFPFSHMMQRWLGEELTLLIDSYSEFAEKFGPDFNMMIRISADSKISDNVIKGPTIFKKNRSVEYTVFLPYSVIIVAPDGCILTVKYILSGIRSIFMLVGIDTIQLDKKTHYIIKHICSNSSMLKKPWPIQS